MVHYPLLLSLRHRFSLSSENPDVNTLRQFHNPDALAEWVRSVDEKAARELAIDGDAETAVEAAEIELVALEVKKERVADSYIEDIISKDVRNTKLASIEVERVRLTELLGRLAATLERRDLTSSILGELLTGDVTYPGLGDVVPGVDVDHETDDEGYIVKETWSWSDVATELAYDAVAVRDGKKKALTKESIKWVQRLVEIFDIHIVINGEEDELPVWDIKGSIPLVNRLTDSRHKRRPWKISSNSSGRIASLSATSRRRWA